jgi:hypothetical protein
MGRRWYDGNVWLGLAALCLLVAGLFHVSWVGIGLWVRSMCCVGIVVVLWDWLVGCVVVIVTVVVLLIRMLVLTPVSPAWLPWCLVAWYGVLLLY